MAVHRKRSPETANPDLSIKVEFLEQNYIHRITELFLRQTCGVTLDD